MQAGQCVVARLLLTRRDSDSSSWPWLVPSQQPSRKDANKFLLGCILDYQILANTAWNNAKRLAEEILGDPEDLWDVITSVSLADWNSRRREYRLHRFPKGHERVYTIGKRIAALYRGDARSIWTAQTIEATLYRLNDLGVGPDLSRMVVGGLVDTGNLQGKADVKPDRHVRRVLGRILNGEGLSADQTAEAIDLARGLHPDNPWLLDRPLFRLGKGICTPTAPKCSACFMNAACEYLQSRPAMRP